MKGMLSAQSGMRGDGGGKENKNTSFKKKKNKASQEVSVLLNVLRE